MLPPSSIIAVKGGAMKASRLCLASVVLATLATISPVRAEYPEKLVRWIVTMPPGGANDILVRPLAQRLSDAIGQSVIVENRGGGGGLIGAEATVKSPPDGYTVVMLSTAHAIGATLYSKVSYDLGKDFTHITPLATSATILVVAPSLPVKSVKEMIAFAKARPDQLAFSSAGNGSPTHLAAELFKYMTGVKMTHVPYKGGGPSMVALLSGEVSLSFASISSAIPHVRANKLRALAVASAKRSPSVPELPTISEAGVPGYDADIWYGLSGPAGMPKDVVARLHTDILKVLKSPDIVKQLDQAGFQVRTSTPKQYTAFIRSEVDKWGKVVKAANMHAD
jgi:tripartite-type tricarboxylate transporter receptor subunit TctC